MIILKLLFTPQRAQNVVKTQKFFALLRNLAFLRCNLIFYGAKMNPEIDWNWVKTMISKKERITSDKKEISNTLDECMGVSKSLAKPKITSAVKKTGDFRIASKRLASELKGVTEFYFFLVTIGGGLEKTATESMSKGNDLKGYLFDRIGSFAVESLAENLEENLRREYGRKGKSVSMRFSPGYCDWPIEEQFALSKILDFSKAGVRLTESCMMIPQKSISGVIAVGPKGLFKDKKPPCYSCDVKDCYYSRIG